MTSKLLPVPHGFSTREGGVSSGPYASLNLGGAVGDAPERVLENHRRLAAAAGLPLERLFTVTQVHGDRVLEVTGRPPQVLGSSGDADGLWTQSAGAWVGVRAADCVPVLLVDEDGQRVAAVHSGWRGTDARIVHRAVEALARAGARPDRLLAVVGPAIGPCCYEVSPELGERFRRGFGEGVVRPVEGRPHLDLPAAVAQTLRAAGVREDRLEVLARCTACEPAVFYSHRRDQGATGRHLGFVACAFS